MQWEMQAEADAALVLVILPTGKEKHPLLLPGPNCNRLCRVRIYRIILITKLKLHISCHPTHTVAGSKQGLPWWHRTRSS